MGYINPDGMLNVFDLNIQRDSAKKIGDKFIEEMRYVQDPEDLAQGLIYSYQTEGQYRDGADVPDSPHESSTDEETVEARREQRRRRR